MNSQSRGPQGLERMDIKVRYQYGTYSTRTVRGQRASCSAAAEEAVRLLCKKLLGDAGELVSLRAKRWPIPSEYCFDVILRHTP